MTNTVTVAYDEGGFVVGGQRIWLISGSVHYFRVPSALWHDRLLKAKRAGLNCISTYVAWNVHEPLEGRWELTGDKDICAFVKTAAELGLYVILRPGPYICADWDFGGLPAWLTTKTGMAYRTSNAAYMHYYDKYFRQVLPRLAEMQVTRGGNILLVQNENGYYYTTMPDRLSYLEFTNQLLRRSGFDIPIITCNALTDPPAPDAIECATGCRRAVQELKRVRLRQPNLPLILMEFHTGGFDAWGGEHHVLSARETARRAMEVVGMGAQLNYYMWHGGTNFGFYGSRLSASDASYETTSYDYDAPLAEGGGLTEKYYLTRLVNMLGNHMGRFLGGCTSGPPGATVQDSPCVYNLTGPAGRWVFVSNGGREEIDSVRLSLASGPEMDVSLAPFGAAAVPAELRLTPDARLDYANLTPLGWFNENVLVLHGPAGWPARWSINGKVADAEVPADDEPLVIEAEGGVRVVVVNSDLAMRTWHAEQSLVFGPRFVGATVEDVVPGPGKQTIVLDAEGKVTRQKVRPVPGERSLSAPRLKPWKRISVCVEPVSSDLAWQPLAQPSDVDRLGLHSGYVWYRMEWEEPRARKRNLFLPDCEDRATVYVNGELAGTWGRGDGASRAPLGANIRRGANTLVALLDNLGRPNFGSRLGQAKGLWGPVYEAKCIRVRKPRVKKVDKLPRRVVPRHLMYLIPELEASDLWSIEVDLPMPEVVPVHVAFNDVPCHVAALCNDRPIDFFPCHGRNFGDMTLTSALQKGKNLLTLLVWSPRRTDLMDKLAFHSLVETVSDSARWGYRPCQVPEPGGPIVGKDQPAWYATNFRYEEERDPPLFLHVVGARKGQVYINGQNAGRFWTTGPQAYYYLPKCWLREDNELVLFVESGDMPRRTRLEFRPQGPYRP